MLLKKNSVLLFIVLLINHFGVESQVLISLAGHLPERVSNNAVCEGFNNGVPFLYSFAGIDSTKTQAGIHLKSYGYNIQSGVGFTLPNLPDTMGKIGCAANRIGDIIYITGGYHVMPNSNEVSSNKMHRFEISTNTFLSDGPNLPEATDDHVQVVWKDSLLLLITGWQNNGNIPNVQIYNPSLNTWEVGTAVPNNNLYKSFGSSGVVLNNSIYYFGGASSSGGFNAQNTLRKGDIDVDNPTQITWTDTVLSPTALTKYRAAATTVGHSIHWIGGSGTTYNYDGIAYNGSGGVQSTNHVMYTTNELLPWSVVVQNEIPMDLRGIANTSETVKYIAGGMIGNQQVTNNVYKLSWDSALGWEDLVDGQNEFSCFPNPVQDQFTIHFNEAHLKANFTILSMNGKVLKKGVIGDNELINLKALEAGTYLLVLNTGHKLIGYKKIIKL